MNSPNRLSIQISENKHLYNGKYNERFFINYSHTPNCFINTNKLEVITLRDIQEEEELFFDYNQTEAIISHPFNCWCGNQNYQSWISGYKKASP